MDESAGQRHPRRLRLEGHLLLRRAGADAGGGGLVGRRQPVDGRHHAGPEAREGERDLLAVLRRHYPAVGAREDARVPGGPPHAAQADDQQGHVHGRVRADGLQQRLRHEQRGAAAAAVRVHAQVRGAAGHLAREPPAGPGGADGADPQREDSGGVQQPLQGPHVVPPRLPRGQMPEDSQFTAQRDFKALRRCLFLVSLFNKQATRRTSSR